MEKAGRSIGGCWTCRARRKKCDETRPTCHNCNSLELICAGYGPKPDWMDASTQEKQRAEEFKLAVREFYHRKRLRRVSGIRVSEAGHPEMPPAFNLQTNTINNSHSQSFDIRFRSMRNEITRKVTIDTFDNNSSASYADIVDWSAFDSEVFSNKAKQSTKSCDSDQNYCENRQQFQSLQNSPRGATRKSTTVPETWYNTCLLPDDLTTSEAYLLMHYLDHVFYLQFPFYRPSVADSGRGWLLSLLTQTKPMYHAALGLSALHLQSLKEKPMMVRGNVNYDTLPRYLAPALQGLQQYVMDFRTTHDSSIPKMIEILACIFMLISIELFKGGTSHWRLHLQAGLSLLPDLIAKICSSPPLPEQMTMNLLTGTFIWLDVISGVSTSWNPTLREAYECLLTDGKIRLETVMGCENWVIIIILRILKLDHWKRQSRQHGYLSKIELTRRVHQIEEAILKGRQYNSGALDEPGFDPALFGVNPGSVEFVTSIFASSVQIYLHLAVSGRRAKLPEIQQSVNDTIYYFKKLPSIKLVGSLAWPFYVAACMALGEQRDFFRDLATSADMDWCLLGSFWRAFQVVEKCWKIWDTETGDLDCVAAMQSMWIQILLA